MPHHPQDRRYPHLRVERASEPLERRRSGGRAPPPARDRTMHGRRMETIVTSIQSSAPLQNPAGAQFDPHLVFRLPTEPGTPIDDLTRFLENAGIVVVSVEPDKTLIAFKQDADLTAFRDQVRGYQQLQASRTTGELRRTTDQEILAFVDIERMGLLTPAERLGPKLLQELEGGGGPPDPTRTYTVEVEAWSTGDISESQHALAEVESLVTQSPDGGIVLDTFAGRTVILAKVRVNGAKLQNLLEQPIIAEIELPPKPSLVSITAERALIHDLPVLEPALDDAPRVCVLDSGIASGHPLLGPYVGHEESFLASGGVRDIAGHGTRVAAVAVHGDMAEQLRRRMFQGPVIVFSGRVLNDEGHFDDDELLLKQLARAVETFANAPYRCNVFNLSLGTGYPSPAYITGKQTVWAEMIDRISAHYGILFIVSAGNNYETFVLGDRPSEDQMQRYPDTLFGPEARLNDPATAALALTVGSLAQSDDVSSEALARGDIVRPIAGRDEPSPFTRTGPSLQGAVKPEFVDYGGNLVFGRFGTGRGVDTDNASGILTLNHEWMDTPFAFEVGTSLAAPRVSRLAAMVWKQLQDQLDEPVTANLVRAVLANSAHVPAPAIARLGANGPYDERVMRVCGYGRPDEDLALESGDRVTTLIAQGELELDRFVTYGVPIPAEFVEAPGEKHISVALAYDPPVRRRRTPYLGVSMQFDMLRGIGLEDVHEAYRRLEADEEAQAITDARRLSFEPGVNTRKRGTLQKGEFTFQRTQHNSDNYWLVVRAIRKWAPMDVTVQKFAVAVTLRAEEPRLYNLVRNRLTERVRGRLQL